MKLYLVRCKGMTSGIAGEAHGIAYVVAEDSATAYSILRTYLDNKDIGFAHEREMDSVTLIADNSEFCPCRTRLFCSLAF